MSLPLPIHPAQAAPLQLRPYQVEAHVAIRKTWEYTPGAMLVLATGAGKTLTALSLAVSDFLEKGKRVVWLAMRQELLDQPMDELRKHWPQHALNAGIVQAERNAPDAQIVFGSVQTLMNPMRLDAVLEAGRPDLVVCDEAHHAVSATYKAVTDALDAPLRLGLTATPDRTDAGDLSADWEISFAYSIDQAIRNGFLVPPYAAVSRLPDLDLSGVSGRNDYQDAELAAALLKAGIVDHTVATMSETLLARRLPERDTEAYLTAKGRACLVYTPTVEVSRLIAEALREAGWKARYISGKTPKEERRRLLDAFRKGLIDVLCNAQLLNEGTDIPRASCVVLARPTRSWNLYCQMVGRALRLYPGKEKALILDLAGASEDHSLISAPVLIGGSRCDKSPDGQHVFEPMPKSEKGKCVHCGRKIACFKLLGAHNFTEDHRCSGCLRSRCVGSDDRQHHWLPQADHTKLCLGCAVSIPDPLAGLLKKRGDDPIEAKWVRVTGVVPETWVVDVGVHGMLYVQGDRDTELWQPIWLKKGGRIPRPLTSEPIPKAYVRAYADDLVRRDLRTAAEKGGGSGGVSTAMEWDARSLGIARWKYRTRGEWGVEMLRARARRRALKTGIVKRVLTRHE